MADIDWHYIENQFDNSTKNSYKRARQQGEFHGNTLGNAPGSIAAVLLNRIGSALTPFVVKYDLWQQKRGQFKGATQAYNEALDLFSAEGVEQIDSAFRGAFARGTVQYTSAFPQGRAPFQTGAGDLRITALGNLKTRCVELLPPLEAELATAQGNGSPQEVIDASHLRVLSLTSAKNMANTTWLALSGLRSAQDDLESERDLARTAIEPLREALADALYANMCGLAQVLNTKALRPQVATFFNLEILRETAPEEEEVAPIPPVVPPVP